MLLQFNRVYKKHNKNFNIIRFNLLQFLFNKIESIHYIYKYLEMLYWLYCNGIDNKVKVPINYSDDSFRENVDLLKFYFRN